jgi:hypothetical protein
LGYQSALGSGIRALKPASPGELRITEENMVGHRRWLTALGITSVAMAAALGSARATSHVAGFELTAKDAGIVGLAAKDAGALDLVTKDAGSFDLAAKDAAGSELVAKDAAGLELAAKDAAGLGMAAKDGGVLGF